MPAIPAVDELRSVAAGEWVIRNASTQRIGGWRAEFTVPLPANVMTTWPAAIALERIGTQRYALVGTQPVDGGATCSAGMRVEPGNPDVLPGDIRITAAPNQFGGIR